MTPEYLHISENDIAKLKNEDYQMDAWLNGKPLIYNEKYDMASWADRSSNLLARAILPSEEKKKFK